MVACLRCAMASGVVDIGMIDTDAFVIVPVKSFRGAKRRLAPMLGVAERAELARIMLGDVLAAVVAAVAPERVGVVSSDGEVADYARSFGVGIVDDEADRGTNAAVKVGLAAVARRGESGIMVLPGDVPGVTSVDIAAVLAAARRGRVALAPASRDGGTNALALDKIGRIAPCFGPDSFARHVGAASAAGIRPVVVQNRRLGLDLDEPDHLVAFLNLATPTRTDSYLRSLGLEARRGSEAGHAAPSLASCPRRLSVEMR